MFAIILIVVCVGCAVVWFVNSQNKATQDKAIEALVKNGFVNSKTLPVTASISLSVDDANKKIAVRNGTGVRIVDYKDILSYELSDDEGSIMKGSMTGAIIGGLTFGVAGAIIGSAGSSKKQKTSSLFVRIMVNSLNQPQAALNFLEMQVTKGDAVYQAAMERAKNVMVTLKYIENQVREAKELQEPK